MSLLIGTLLLGASSATAVAAGPEMSAGASVAASASGAAPFRIAVSPFASEMTAGVDVAGVIEADLMRSGAFKPLARSSTVAAGATHTLTGTVAAGQVRFSLREVATDAELIGSAVAVARPDLMRDAAHQVADSVYERLTGVPGAFNTKLLFVAKKTDGVTHELVVCDADGENPRVLAASREPFMSPAWSPDRTRIAFAGFDKGRSAIFVLTPATGAVRKLVSEVGVNGAPAWSPDGRSLALTMSVAGSPDIYVIDLESGARRRLTDSKSIDTEPTWSPDGRSIAFTSDRGGSPQVYVMPSSGGAAKRVTQGGRQNLRPQYAPDGRTMAVVNLDQGKYRIALVDLESGKLRRLTDGPFDESPSFSPNGKALTYSGRGKQGRSQLHVTSLDGKVRQAVRSGEDGREPAWSPLAR